MAGVSFMDLLLAQALAAGLEREARTAARPPPDNFFRLPNDPGAWKKLQEAWKEENMVIALEITDDVSDSCRQLQPIFMDHAREFDNIPFLRVQIGFGGTFDELRKDLGGVQYTPTFLVVFFGDGSTYRAKYEGTLEIKSALQNGRFKAVIKEFMERRVKLKLAERLASNLADRVNIQMNDRERQIRQEYEDRMRKQMAERDEQVKKEEDEKKQKEEEEQQKLDQQRMRASELRKEARPQHIEELRKLNLKTAPIREIKTIMHKMGVTTHDCFERGDLVKKLMDSCPELRLAQEQPGATASREETDDLLSPNSSASIGLQSRAEKAEKDVENMEMEISSLRSQLAAKNKDVEGLNTQLRKMAMRVNSAEAMQRSGSGGEDKVRELEMKLLETRMLYTTTLNDFKVLGVICNPGTKDEGLVVRAKCIKKGLPNPDRIYAMKVLTDYFPSQTQTKVRTYFQNEYQILFQLPPHKNIIKMWAFFFDRTDPKAHQAFANLNRKLSLFLLMDEHTTNMKDCLETLVNSRGPNPGKVIVWFRDLLKGLMFLESFNVIHRDLKLDNLLMDEHGNIVISDFGQAVVLKDDMKLHYQPGYGGFVGGNTAHLSPEVLNAKQGHDISYSKQPVWAAGVLAYELAGHKNPFEGGNIDQRGYHITEVPPLKRTSCTKDLKFCQPLPPTLTKLVSEMLDSDPDCRPNLLACLEQVSEM